MRMVAKIAGFLGRKGDGDPLLPSFGANSISSLALLIRSSSSTPRFLPARNPCVRCV